MSERRVLIETDSMGRASYTSTYEGKSADSKLSLLAKDGINKKSSAIAAAPMASAGSLNEECHVEVWAGMDAGRADISTDCDLPGQPGCVPVVACSSE